MKKFIYIPLLFLVVCVNAHAQLKVDFGSYAVGATANVELSSDYTNPGVGLTVQKFLGDKLRANVRGEYFFRQNRMSLIEWGADFHYVFPLTKKMGVYPVVGMGYSIMKFKGGYVSDILPGGIEVVADDEETGAFHFNLGVGYEYYVTPDVKAFGEVKYHHIKDYGRTLLSIGVAYVW